MGSIESIHARWLDQMAAYSWAYMKRLGISQYPESIGAIVNCPDESKEYVFTVRAKFPLPPASRVLIESMAMFTSAKFENAHGIDGLVEGKRAAMPKNMYCLHSLLFASNPRDVGTNRFKGTDAADWDVGAPKGVCNAFCGFGVVLMRACSKHFGELLTEEEVLEKAKEHYLCVVQ